MKAELFLLLPTMYDDQFTQVEKDWNLPQLYEDLCDIRDRALSPLEKMWLRGLIHCGSRNALAKELKQDPEQFRIHLNTHLYPAIAELTNVPKVTSSKIPELLEAKGYRRTSRRQKKQAGPVTQMATATKSSYAGKVILSVAGVIFTIATGVVIETSTGFITDNLAGRETQASVPEKMHDVDVPSGVFNYGGSTTWAPIRAQVDTVIAQKHADFQLRYVDPVAGNPGSGAGIQMLLKNQLAFAQTSRPLQSEEYQAARDSGFTLKEIPIAIDGIAVAVHPGLSITGLTIDQLSGIYTGKITNWQAVGGPNLPVQAFSRRVDAGGTVKFFVDNVLGNETLGLNVQYVDSTTLGVRQVSQTPGSIYFASAPELLAQCSVKPIAIGRESNALVFPNQDPYLSPEACLNSPNQINLQAFKRGDYPITRRLFIVVKENDQADQEAGESYAQLLLTQEGQQLIEQLGFVSERTVD